MKNGWTQGQYSIVRVIFGLYLLIHFVQLLPWSPELFSNRGMLPDASSSPLIRLFPNILAIADSSLVVQSMLVVAVLGSLAFMLGVRDRIAAVMLWYILACLFGRNPLISNPSLPYIGWLLLAYAALPPRRSATEGIWKLPPAIFAATWIVMAVGYSYSGSMKLISPSWVDGTAVKRILENPLARPSVLRDLVASLPDGALAAMTWGTIALELLYAPLALGRRVRPFLWLAMLSLQICLMMLIDFADLSLGMIVLHLFTFDPAWIPGRKAEGPEILFYDGTCGVCHGAVKFLLHEDPAGVFRFAPLDSDEFRRLLATKPNLDVPDSVVVLADGGEILVRSDAMLHVLGRLCGLWRVVAAVARLIPRRLRDAFYDWFAANRRRFAPPPSSACPMVPAEVRSRFVG